MKFLGNLFGSGLSFFTGGGWIPLLVAAAIGAFAAAWIQDYRIDGLRAERDAKADQLELARGDANRWRVAADTANAANEMHNAEVEKARADLAKTESILATMDEVSAAEAADLKAQIIKWKEKARAKPDQTCKLGPLDRDAVRVLVAP